MKIIKTFLYVLLFSLFLISSSIETVPVGPRFIQDDTKNPVTLRSEWDEKSRSQNTEATEYEVLHSVQDDTALFFLFPFSAPPARFFSCCLQIS